MRHAIHRLAEQRKRDKTKRGVVQPLKINEVREVQEK